jgi:1-deoxy-D-xylulose-5-phosphate reductoisomerase
MVGIAGLTSVHFAIQKGKKVLLANKESYVVAGEYLNNLCKETGATIFPIDSEHSAIHQCLNNEGNNSGVSRIILTGSGGPFLTKDANEFSSITPEDAINHPVWSMGKKISVDSSTLMNKGLEVIEARWLFDCENIEVLIHPEGIIHSLVEFKDNSVLAQLSNPDMKIPIAYGLGYPNRINSGTNQLNLHEIKSLNFQEPDTKRFPCLKLATDLLPVGGTSFSILNASNEECVSAFLDGRISYMQIYEIISKVLDRINIKSVQSLQDIFESDKESRMETTSIINN